MQSVLEKNKAGYPLLWINTAEYSRVIASIRDTFAKANKKDTKIYTYDPHAGVQDLEGNKYGEENNGYFPIEFLTTNDKKLAVMLAVNFHSLLEDVILRQALLNALNQWKSVGKTFVIISPVIKLDPELEKYVTILDFDLPNADDLTNHLKRFCDTLNLSDKAKFPLPENIVDIVKSGRGLTEFEFENALSLSIVSKKKIDPAVVLEMKQQLIKKSGMLEISKYKGGFDTVIGLDNLKWFILKAALKGGRGVVIQGVQGCGKSLIGKAAGNELGIPTLLFDVSKVLSSYVGESQQNMDRTLKVIEAMAPCVVIIDEIEKAFGGMESSHATDGGTMSQLGGKLLTWLQDKPEGIYPIATSNNLELLPPELIRTGRWDGTFFVDLPTVDERTEMFEYYRQYYKLPPAELDPSPQANNWTGAEIETCCRLSSMLDLQLEETSKMLIKPLAVTMKEKIQRIRDWSRDRAIPASKKSQITEAVEARMIQ